MCVCVLPRMKSTDIATLTQVSAADSAPFRHFENLQLTLQTADRKKNDELTHSGAWMTAKRDC